MGHATVLIELDGVRLLTDPVLRSRVAHLKRIAGLPLPSPRALGQLDAIAVSHLHIDHFDRRSIELFDRSVTVLVPRGPAVRMLSRRGFDDVRGLEVGRSTPIGAVDVRAVRARHQGWRVVPWINGPALGYVVRGSASVYFAGDTDIFPEMGELEGVDLALLPVAGWGRRLPEGHHMNADRAAQALRLLRPRFAIPIHWGSLAPFWKQGAYPVQDAAAPAFSRLAAEVAPEVEVRVLRAGESFVPPPPARPAG